VSATVYKSIKRYAKPAFGFAWLRLAGLRLEVKYQVFNCTDTYVFFSGMHVSGAHGLDIRVSLEDKDVSDSLRDGQIME